MFSTVLLLSLLSTTANAREWTNTAGKKITAEIVRVEGSDVVLEMKGKEVNVAMDKLSAADNDFIRMWQDDQKKEETPEASADTSTGATKGRKKGKRGKAGATTGDLSNFTLNGKGLLQNGKHNLIEVELSEDVATEFSKKKTITKMKLSISLPPGFDPTKPQKVLWISQAINNAEQQKRGNESAATNYAKTACPAGWMVLGVDVDGGNPRGYGTKEDAYIQLHALDYLEEQWPGFKNWQFACCGFSGGAKLSFYRLTQLVSAELDVKGHFITGCNAQYMDEARKVSRCSKSDLKKVKLWVSCGKRDKIASLKSSKAVAKQLDSYYGKMKVEEFAGDHMISKPSLKNALAWFLTDTEE